MRTKNAELMSRIAKHIENKFYSTGIIPSIREIAQELNISKSCVGNYLAEMKEKGLVESNGYFRGITTLNMSKVCKNVQYLPIVGNVSCGVPFLAEENIQNYLPISTEFLGVGKYFILKAKGQSMINAGIDDGNYVIIRQQENAEQGQIVVALINDEATLKRYYLDKEKKQVRLHPENDNMNDMFFDNIIIQGIAVKVIKDLQ